MIVSRKTSSVKHFRTTFDIKLKLFIAARKILTTSISNFQIYEYVHLIIKMSLLYNRKMVQGLISLQRKTVRKTMQTREDMRIVTTCQCRKIVEKYVEELQELLWVHLFKKLVVCIIRIFSKLKDFSFSRWFFVTVSIILSFSMYRLGCHGLKVTQSKR